MNTKQVFETAIKGFEKYALIDRGRIALRVHHKWNDTMRVFCKSLVMMLVFGLTQAAFNRSNSDLFAQEVQQTEVENKEQQADDQQKPPAKWDSLKQDKDGFVDLLAESDFLSKEKLWKVPDQHFFEKHGEVQLKDGILVLAEGAKGTGVVANFEVPRINYEVQFEARRKSGSDFFCGLTFPFEKQQATLILGGWGGSTVGISNINRFSAVENMTSRTVPFQQDQWYQFQFTVAEESIELKIDGKTCFWLDPIDRKFETWWEQRPMEPLGFASWMSTGEIRKLKIRKLPESSNGEE